MAEEFERTGKCKDCGKMFVVENKRGAVPKYCPECKSKKGGLDMQAIFEGTDALLASKGVIPAESPSVESEPVEPAAVKVKAPEPAHPVSDDVIEHPAHYCEGRKYEPLAVIMDWQLDYCLGNALKYISRAGRKGNKLEDLKKAAFYLNFAITQEEAGKA